MTKRSCRISLKHFMVLSAVFPLIAGTVAGVFGQLLALLAQIVLVAVLWYAGTCFALLAAVEVSRRVGVSWPRESRRTDRIGWRENGMGQGAGRFLSGDGGSGPA